MKRILVGLGIIFLVIIAAGTLFIVTNRDRLVNIVVEKSFGNMERAILDHLPESVSSSDVKDLFIQVKQKIKTGKVNGDSLRAIVLTFQNSIQDQNIDQEETEKILDRLKEIIEQDIE